MLADLPLADLHAYRPDVAEPEDFDGFWTEQLAAARSHRAEPVFTLTDSPVRHADVYDPERPAQPRRRSDDHPIPSPDRLPDMDVIGLYARFRLAPEALRGNVPSIRAPQIILYRTRK